MARGRAAQKKTDRPFGRGSGVPHPTDVYVGARVRHLRRMRGLTQGEVAKVLGLTFQQLQKYESGANRLSASRLLMVARFLGIEVGWFFEGLPAKPTPADVERLLGDPVYQRDMSELIGTIDKLSDPVRQALLHLVRTVAAPGR